MAVNVRFEVWTRPETGTFERKFPLQGVTNWSLELGLFGRGSVTIPRSFPRFDEIISINSADRSLDEASMIRAFIDETHLYDFYAVRSEESFGDKNTRTATITGGGLGTAFDRAVVRQFDYNTNPSLQPNHVYGGPNTLLRNEGFEDGNGNGISNPDFDEGNVDGWTPITGSDTNELDDELVTTDAEFQAGTHSLEIDPGKRHSGAKTTIDVVPGQQVTIDGYVKGSTTGRRITAVVKGQDEDTYQSTNGYMFNGWHIVEIGNVARNPARNGLPGGSTDGTWQALGTIKVTPGPDTTSITYGVQDDHHNDTNGPIFWIDSFDASGLGMGMEPWMPHELTAMDIDTIWAYGNGQSAQVTGPNGSAIYQDIDGMIVGVIYSASFWVYQQSGTAKDITAQFSIVGNPDSVVKDTVSVGSNTWTQLHVTWTATTSEGRLEVKNESGAALTWWVDETSGGPGLPPQTYGAIMGDMIQDAAVDHAPGRTTLAWLTENYSDTVDSNSVAWDKNVSFSINRGQPYRRILTFHGDNFGYEARIKPNPADITELILDLYIPEGMGQDFTTGDGGAILKNGLISFGPVIRREPLASYAMVEGDQLYWAEDENADIKAAWGAIETYVGTDEVLVASLADMAGRLTTGTESETMTCKFQAPTLIPGVDYDLGDIVRVALGEDYYPAGTHRVMAIDISQGDPEPIFQVQFASEQT